MNSYYVSTNEGYKSFIGMPQDVVESMLDTTVVSYTFITKDEFDAAILAQQ